MNRMNTAFTLLEVVVVTAVIGILAALVVPRFADARNQTTVTSAAEDLHTIAQALSLYQGVNGSFPPNASRDQDAINMAEFFKNFSPFEMSSPIGGVYDYDGPPNFNPVSISIVSDGENKFDPLQAVELDELMDDGDLRTGRLKLVNARLRYRFAKN